MLEHPGAACLAKGATHYTPAPTHARRPTVAQPLAPHPGSLPARRGPTGPALPHVARPAHRRTNPGLSRSPRPAAAGGAEHLQPGPLRAALLLPGNPGPRMDRGAHRLPEARQTLTSRPEPRRGRAVLRRLPRAQVPRLVHDH